MTNEKKLLFGIIGATVVILIGAVIWLGSSSSKATLEKVAGAKIETLETNFDFQDIPYSGGNVEHAYKIKNVGNKELQIANMQTSCMCTEVYLKTEKETGPKFGMVGHSQSSSWTGKLAPGEEGEVIVIFDPTAHGPQGVGFIERITSFDTNDPDNPYVEFSFKGNVVK